MPFQVVHAQRGPVQRGGQRAGHAGAHQQCAGQARASGEGHHVDIGQRGAGLGQHLTGQWQYTADVVTRGQLGHHATKGLVHQHLAVQSMGAQLRQGHAGLKPDQGHTGFVARRFNAQHIHAAAV